MVVKWRDDTCRCTYYSGNGLLLLADSILRLRKVIEEMKVIEDMKSENEASENNTMAEITEN